MGDQACGENAERMAEIGNRLGTRSVNAILGSAVLGLDMAASETTFHATSFVCCGQFFLPILAAMLGITCQPLVRQECGDVFHLLRHEGIESCW